MKIQTKLVLMFSLISIMILGLNGYIFITNGRSAVTDRIKKQLESVVVLKENQLNNYLELAIGELEFFVEGGLISNYFGDESGAPGSGDEKEVAESLERKLSNSFFTELYILSIKNGEILISTDEKQKGKIKEAESLFIEGKKETSIQNFYYDISSNKPVTTISTPIVNDSNQTLGVLVGKVDMKEISEIMIERSGLGETGETYLVNKYNYVVSDLKKEKDAVLKKAIFTNNVVECLGGNTGFAENLDYLDEDVIEQYKWIADRDICILAKIDKTEAFKSINDLRNIVIMTGVVLIVASLVVGGLLSRSISIPILKLEEAAASFGRGKLDTDIEIKSGDELEDLGKVFKNMATRLKNLYGSLEKTVETRTSELAKAKEDLERQQAAILNVLEDVSEEKTFEEKQSESVLQTIGEGVVLTNDEGVVTYINPSFIKMFGFSEEEIKGKVFSGFIKAFDIKKERLLDPKLISDTAAVTSSAQESKIFLASKTGEKKAVVINAAPIRVENEFKGVVRILHNFSEDLRIQKQKDDFFSIASHELRTPLTVISGNLDIIFNTLKNKTKLSKEEAQLVADTEVSADRLIKMVSDFLNVSRLDQSRLETRIVDIDLCKVTGEVIKEMKTLTDQKGLELKNICNKKHGLIKADENLLKEIFINLIGNAIKFTEKGGITVQHKTKENMISILISDTGLGISKENQPLLFKRFQQAQSRTRARHAGGTGLGLYISREFARLMRGDIKLVRSEPSKGTTFELTLPLAISDSKEQKIVANKMK